jgi:REP element-mobilizing transposase RayT
MTRKPRVHYEDAIYHVIVRGNNRESVFAEDEEKRKYLNILADYKQRYGFNLFAYVIMSNHAHLLIQVKTVPLSKIMQGIQLRYTRYYNQHYHRTGHAFEQRYKAFLCQDENYLFTLLCYIHQNPIRANFPEGFTYPWSSHHDYLGFSSLVDNSFIFDILHPDKDVAIRQYLEIVGAPIDNPHYKHQNYEKTPPHQKPETKMKHSSHLMSWKELITQIVTEENVNLHQLIGKCRLHHISAARRRLVYEAIENNLLTRQQLAKELSLDYSRISQLYQEFKQSMVTEKLNFEKAQT